VPTLITRVWQRYGQLRIYVSAGELAVGWCDPRSGRFQLRHPEMEAGFWTAIRAECQRLLQDGRLSDATLPLPAASEQPQPARDQAVIVRDPGWDDLARNVPGAAARAHAQELRRAHPLLTAAADILGIRTTARSFAIGAEGERMVGRKLNRWAARQGWHVLYAVPVGQRGTDIDHVVIAPFGVVTVNTKATKAAVWVGEYGMTVGGRNVDHLRKSRAEARRARRLLSLATGIDVPVQPAIVFVGPRRFALRRGGPSDVAVLPSPRALRRWLRRQRHVLEPSQVVAIYEAARKPTSWQGRRTRTD
jgi:Nuclease-related domain